MEQDDHRCSADGCTATVSKDAMCLTHLRRQKRALQGDRPRWNKPGIPHKGWTWVGVTDLEDLIGRCDMCDNAYRYAHTMTHDEHRQLVVGCVCAGHMCEDYVNPKAAEHALVLAAKRKKEQEERSFKRAQRKTKLKEAFLEISAWSTMKEGLYAYVSPTVLSIVDRYTPNRVRVLIIEKEQTGWTGQTDRYYLGRWFPTREEAMEAVFSELYAGGKNMQ